MLRAGGDDIDACGIDAAVTENVCKLGNVSLDAVKHTGEQMPQVVRKDLTGINISLRTERFHLPPDVCAADRFAGPCYEDTA